MKVIISHDVDHITAFEHLTRDFVIPKFIFRSFVEYVSGNIGKLELRHRILELKNNKWNYVDELLEFDGAHNVPSTFFVGVSNGLGLNYSLKNAEKLIKKIKSNGFDVGVHGICFKNYKKMREEFKKFYNIVGHNKFGIRMHYLRTNNETLLHLSKIGYLFDSTIYNSRNPYRVGKMWEFPLHIMDNYIFEGIGGHFQKTSFEEAKGYTEKIIEKIQERGISYLIILFHDRFFSNSYITIKKWYEWLIESLLSNSEKFQFISYKDAIKELERNGK